MTRNKFQDTLKPIAGGNAGGSFGGGGGGGGKLESLTDFLKQGNFTVGQSVTWNGSKWTNDVPDTYLNGWVSTASYANGAVVVHQGSLWKATQNSNNQEPGTHSRYWQRLDMGYVRWQPNTPYPKGTIAIVPSDRGYFMTWDSHDLVTNDCDHYSLWMATSDILGNLPVTPGEPVSVSSVCPGTFVPTDKTGAVSPGSTVYCDSWMPITPPSLYLVRDLAALFNYDFNGPWIYGNLALVTEGEGRGDLFKLEKSHFQINNDGYMGNVGRRCWNHLGHISDLTGISLHWMKAAYDPRYEYREGTVAVFNEKVYEAVAPMPLFPGQWAQGNVAWNEVTGTIDTFFNDRRKYVFWTNTGATPVSTGDHLNHAFVPPNSSIYSLGIPESSPSVIVNGVQFNRGYLIGTNVPFTVLMPDDVTALEEARINYNTVRPGQSPLTHPEKWKVVGEPNLVTQAVLDELNNKIDALTTGIQHGAAVTGIVDAPPASPTQGTLAIVGKTPTGDFATHANAVALYDGANWTFTPPGTNEAHLNQADNTIYHWSGTEWNKIGSTNVSVINDLSDVDTVTTAPTEGQTLIFTGGKWKPHAAPGEYPKIIFIDGSHADGSGELHAYAGTFLQSHKYLLEGFISADYNNESDRFQAIVKRDGQPLNWSFSHTWSGAYHSAATISWYWRPANDIVSRYALWLGNYDNGVILTNRWMKITDYGPII